MSYNGWSNWETWNVNLWAMNEEPAYRAVCAGRPYTADSAETLARELFPDGTPDGADLGEVNWDEIARGWNE
jgi:hypothetical protein